MLAELARLFFATLGGVVLIYLVIDFADRAHTYTGRAWGWAAAEVRAHLSSRSGAGRRMGTCDGPRDRSAVPALPPDRRPPHRARRSGAVALPGGGGDPLRALRRPGRHHLRAPGRRAHRVVPRDPGGSGAPQRPSAAAALAPASRAAAATGERGTTRARIRGGARRARRNAGARDPGRACRIRSDAEAAASTPPPAARRGRRARHGAFDGAVGGFGHRSRDRRLRRPRAVDGRGDPG